MADGEMWLGCWFVSAAATMMMTVMMMVMIGDGCLCRPVMLCSGISSSTDNKMRMIKSLAITMTIIKWKWTLKKPLKAIMELSLMSMMINHNCWHSMRARHRYFSSAMSVLINNHFWASPSVNMTQRRPNNHYQLSLFITIAKHDYQASLLHHHQAKQGTTTTKDDHFLSINQRNQASSPIIVNH